MTSFGSFAFSLISSFMILSLNCPWLQTNTIHKDETSFFPTVLACLLCFFGGLVDEYMLATKNISSGFFVLFLIFKDLNYFLLSYVKMHSSNFSLIISYNIKILLFLFYLFYILLFNLYFLFLSLISSPCFFPYQPHFSPFCLTHLHLTLDLPV
jgi:hypothetical protein